MQTEIVVLIAGITAAITAVVTYVLNRPKVNADAITSLNATIASMSLRLDQMSKIVSDVTRDNGMQAVSIERQAFQLERQGVALTESQSQQEQWRKLADKRLLLIDGMPQELLDKAAEILRLKQDAAGLPNVPAVPDAGLTALAAEVKVAENKVGGPADAAKPLHAGDTVKLVEAKE